MPSGVGVQVPPRAPGSRADQLHWEHRTPGTSVPGVLSFLADLTRSDLCRPPDVLLRLPICRASPLG
ncbi:hypothetical protein ACFPRL_15975 [Pseudoclavibacter helvolus]